MRIAIRSKRGHIALEAAIFMPIFIIGIVTLLYIIKFAIAVESANSIGFDHGRRLIRDMTEPIVSLVITEELEERLENEVAGISNVEASYPLPFLGFGITDKVKFFISTFEVERPYPVSLKKETKVRQLYIFRPFVGKDNSSEDCEDPKEREKYEAVWVFPKAGGKYHIKTCSYIEVAATQETLTTSLKLKYKPCNLCKSNVLKNGSTVYCFEKSGKNFHKATCTTVDRYVISMDREDAESKGYTPCTKCGGYK